jgi:hypothetical protein
MWDLHPRRKFLLHKVGAEQEADQDSVADASGYHHGRLDSDDAIGRSAFEMAVYAGYNSCI